MLSLEHTVHDASVIVHDAAVAERLAQGYGSRWHNVWSYVQRDATMRQRVVDQLPYLHAEIAHAVERESACTLSDLLMRRTHVAYETRDHGVAAAERIAGFVGSLLGWSDAARDAALAAYRADVARVFDIDDA
jgi:glycerol-3-phosphate dehydrogenase